MKKVLYHDKCSDGFCSAWLAWLVFGENAQYIPVQYGNDPPSIDSEDELYILDFSYKLPVQREIIEKCKNVVLLDHHKTAKKELESLIANPPGNLSITFDMFRSGAQLTWAYFNPHNTEPSLVSYVADRDLGQWQLPYSKEINDAISSYQYDFPLWDILNRILEKNADRLICEGSSIGRFKKQLIDNACKTAIEIEMDGHKILSTNATNLISEIAGKLAEGRPFGATYFIRGDGKKVWSLRSRDNGIDVSEICKKYGGGGHRNAAGYVE